MDAAKAVQNISFLLCFIDVPAFRAKRKFYAKLEKPLESIAFYSTRRASVTSRNARFEGPKMRSPLYFTGANAFFLGRENQLRKLRFAFTIVFYRQNCDVGKWKSGKFGSFRKCVETLGPTHENDVPRVDGTQRRSENRGIS